MHQMLHDDVKAEEENVTEQVKAIDLLLEYLSLFI